MPENPYKSPEAEGVKATSLQRIKRSWWWLLPSAAAIPPAMAGVEVIYVDLTQGQHVNSAPASSGGILVLIAFGFGAIAVRMRAGSASR